MPLRVGVVGTGYAARKRVEALSQDTRARLVAVVSRTPERTQIFGETHHLRVFESWQSLVQADDIDLVIVATVNALHGAVIDAALNAGKHVVVEYPLALDLSQAESLAQLAQKTRRLLHVEHIERLGGLHRTTVAHLPQVGTPMYVNYRTLNPHRPAPEKWSYNLVLSGFPLVAALSRIHRLTHLFGPVKTVSCHSQYQSVRSGDPNSPYYGTCLCSAQLRFQSGLVAELTYGKGENLWVHSRRMEIQGSQGALVFEGDRGVLITEGGEQSLAVEPRRGLFAKDTAAVLDYLTEGIPLYVALEESLYALKVADTLRRAAETGQCLPVA